MGSRERKRAERRKRKRRAARGGEQVDPGATADQAAGNGHPRSDLAARAEAKNRAARESLVPLGEDERPTVVTIGAVISVVIAVSIVVGYAGGVEVSGGQPHILQVAAPVVLLGVMAWGMWRVRYWAVLGFQTVLLFTILLAAIGLVGATDPLAAVGNFVLIPGCGVLFFFMVKALARIQMPQRRPPA
jgi:hypothetical protein